eukprot:gb/GECG01006140.1/.p1 GENE.gb/GECG01006140.1/~~gb/GECG01006140.1/.p1  ORF type:complete len:151 (+),score=29.97 gb/GECG01006140.1/:1-453(+)
MAASGSKKGSKQSTGSGISHKQYSRFNETASGLTLVVENLYSQLEQIEEDLKADRDGLHDYQAQLDHLQMEREESMKFLRKNREWARKFDEDIGPFEKKFDDLSEDLGELYSQAKRKHGKGIQILIDEFNYHPAFKTPKNDFSAIPFKPK